jgi:gamma-glutamyltranspeptidase/glutathione hydrolase
MRFRHKSLIPLLIAAAWIWGTAAADASTEPVHARHGIVVSIHELASRAGVEMMQAGGNAIDAAVATGFALAVVHSPAGNLGGGGFMLMRMADGKSHFIDYREKAPAAATADMYLDKQGNVIEGASEYGYKAIAVPGSVAGMVYAERKYGRLKLGQVMAAAIRLAREGYALSWGEAADMHDKYLGQFPESRRIFQRDGNFYQPGDIFRQPELARTLERIAANPDDFIAGV